MTDGSEPPLEKVEVVDGVRGGKEVGGRKRKGRGGDKSDEKRRKKEEEKAKQEEEAREEKLYGGEGPEFELKLLEEKKIWIVPKDLQSLVLWLVGEAENPRWIFVKNKALCKNVVTICLDSLTLPVWTKYGKEHMPFLHGLKFHQISTKLQTPTKHIKSNSFLDEFFNKEVRKTREQPIPSHNPNNGVGQALQMLQGQQHNNHHEEVTVPQIAVETAVKMITEYKPSVEDLMEHGFYVSTVEDNTFVETKEADRVLKDSEKIIVIDCEMCLTEHGSELTRVSVLNWCGEVLYDELVKPHNEIVNYLTIYSGITAEMLENVSTTLEDVRSTILTRYLYKEVTIIGHSLENDLKALKIIHHNVCDTTMLYPHFQGPPLKSALKYLAIKFLNRGIQGYKGKGVPQEERMGHDPVEDATAALDLVKMKFEKGRNFGVPSKMKTEPMLRKVEGKSIVIDIPDCISRIPARGCSTDLIPVGSDLEAAKKARKQIASGRYAFSFTHMHLLETYMEALEWADPLTSSMADEEALIKILNDLDTTIKNFYEAAPKHTAFIVATGQVNGVEDAEDESSEEYLRKWDLARQGMAFIGFKKKAAE
eukprot:TRINITY_DN15338_c0_g1_i1.p1 TRINITY_DN15338_c0_g1~~TRINITY_DN15338_c0_g1_i1.p1  ORF type:complete len:602 (+),score=179.26 TRINITY_DN15338_c0_g1_i1:29-1807(+)